MGGGWATGDSGARMDGRGPYSNGRRPGGNPFDGVACDGDSTPHRLSSILKEFL